METRVRTRMPFPRGYGILTGVMSATLAREESFGADLRERRDSKIELRKTLYYSQLNSLKVGKKLTI